MKTALVHQKRQHHGPCMDAHEWSDLVNADNELEASRVSTYMKTTPNIEKSHGRE